MPTGIEAGILPTCHPACIEAGQTGDAGIQAGVILTRAPAGKASAGV
jgi:hypothetical protein